MYDDWFKDLIAGLIGLGILGIIFLVSGYGIVRLVLFLVRIFQDA